jgi:predicted TIM-barrel fold metal-dependent hydrolase
MAIGNRPLISADSHVAETEECYATIDKKFYDQRPRAAYHLDALGAFIEIPGMDMKVPMGSLCRAGVPPEKWGVPVDWDEIHPAGHDPKARLEIQDEEGVAAEVIYPSVGMVICLHPDPDYKKACFDAYNRWLAEFCETAPKRLLGIGMMACRTPAEGVREIKELKAMGFRGVMMCGDPHFEDYDSPAYDPVWEASIAEGMPINFHILTSKDSMGGVGVRGPKMIQQIVTIRGNQNIVMMMVLSGVFDRHPNLKVIMVENDAGWIPHFAFRLDHAWEKHRWWMEVGAIKRKPSEYVHENIYATFQDDYSVQHVINAVNLERVMWATDFPHGDGTYPESRKVIDEITEGMTEHQIQSVVYDNAAALYGLS